MDNDEIKLVRMKKALCALLDDIKTKTFPVDKVILFGSVARDDIHEHSDVDICIVSDDELTPRQKRVEIESYFHDMAKTDFTPEFLYCNNYQVRNGKEIFESIRKDGRVLYQRV